MTESTSGIHDRCQRCCSLFPRIELYLAKACRVIGTNDEDGDFIAKFALFLLPWDEFP